ncbi:MAG: hypothetical protein ACI4N4_07335 [Candidatus Fimenecus sp.]
MTFETLNGNVVLVELSGEEMKRFNITYDTLESDEHTERVIRTILKDIPCDKYPRRDKIIVDALPADNGGCFFIFTFPQAKKRRYRVKKQEIPTVFEMENADDFLDFLSAAKNTMPKNIQCPVYRIENSFYLVFPNSVSEYGHLLGEFGKISSAHTAASICERGKHMGFINI